MQSPNKNIKDRPTGSDRRCAPALYVRRYMTELPKLSRHLL